MSTEEKILAILEKHSEMFGQIQQDISGLKGDFSSMQMDISGIKCDISSMQDDISGLKVDVSGLKQDVADLKEDVSGMQDDISGLKVDVSGLKQDVAGLKEDVSDMQVDIAGLKGDFSDLRQTVTRVAITQENVVIPQIKLLAEGHDMLLQTLAHKEHVSTLEDDVDLLKSVVKTMSQRITALEKAQ